MCSISNSQQFISTLLKVACYNSHEQVKEQTLSRHNSKTLTKKQNNSPIVSRRQSKIRPIALPMDVKLHNKPVKRVNPAIVLSPGNHLRLFFPSTVDTVDGESDHSGYDGDTELCDVWKIDGDEEERSAGSGGLNTPLALVKAPDNIRSKLWMEKPVWQCIELLKECIDDKTTITKWYGNN